MKKILFLSISMLFALSLFAQRKADISVERYYHIQKGKIWFHSIGMNFQPIMMGDVKTENIYLYNSSDQEATLTTDDLPAGYSVTFEPAVIPPRTEAIAKVTLDTEKNGTYGPSINYFFIDSPFATERPYRILVSPNIKEDFSNITESMMEKAPKIEFIKTVSEFGEMPQMGVYEDEFKFSNTGKSDLIIRNVKAGCGCTHTKTSQDTLKPGESAVLSFEFRSGHKRGKQDSKITVVSNDPSQPQVTLHIVGEVLIEEKEDK